MSVTPHAIVLGAYGFIGSACVRALKARGYSVTGVGRSEAVTCEVGLEIDWLIRDIATTSVAQWKLDFSGADIVINASGALQSGLKDNLSAIHERAVGRIVEALALSNTKLVQISAAGASESAITDFMRSKAKGEDLILSSTIDWCILRPCLVLGPQAYGGTALLRSYAAMPFIGFKCFAEAPIQTVYIKEVAEAVIAVIEGRVASRQIYDLAEDMPRSFWETVGAIRQWQGFPAWKATLTLPNFFVRFAEIVADLLGWLGWRSPLRSNAMRELTAGITGDATTWKASGGPRFSSLNETLQQLPATTQERWFARLYLFLPLMIAILAVFWIISGLIGFISFDDAKLVLMTRGVSPNFAGLSVVVGSILDIGLGCLILVRNLTRLAACGMALLSITYLVGASVVAPDLWVDPLGPLVKILPSVLPAFFVWTFLEKR